MSLPSTTLIPLLVTDDPALLDPLLRLCAAAGLGADVTCDPERVRRSWPAAGRILVGEDRADDVAGWQLPRRSHVVLVGTAPGTTATWRRGVALGCEHVALLPDANEWLAETLADCADGGEAAARTVGLVGAVGGAGASTIAAGLAQRAAETGLDVLLVDGDPAGGGLDLLLGCEDVEGLRWMELADTQGRVSAAALRAALPRLDRLAVLSGSAGSPQGVPTHLLRSMVTIGQRGASLVVIDLPRVEQPAAAEAAGLCDVVSVVCTPEVRAVAAARHVMARMTACCPDVRLVLRRTSGGNLSGADVAEILDVPILADLPCWRRLTGSVNDGLGPLTSHRSRRSFDRMLTGLLPGSAA